MSKAQEKSRSDFESWMMKSGRAKDWEFTIGDDQEYIYSHVAEDFSVWCAAVASMSNASSEQQAAQQDAALIDALYRIRRYGLDTLSGRTDGPDDRQWQREAVKEMTSRAAQALAAARASNGGKA